MQIACRWAPSLGALEGTHEGVWGTHDYDPRHDRHTPTAFFGLYDCRDYIALARHMGKAWVLWAGSDIRNLANNFYFNNGKLNTVSRIFSGFPRMLDRWLAKNAEHWVENETEAAALHFLGIPVAGICPSFMGDINKFSITFKPGNNVFLSASEGRQVEYGYALVDRIATRLPHVNFHLYGASWYSPHKNVTVHGRVSGDIMNAETNEMQIGLRTNVFDGFSEITAKAVLRGQYAVARVPHPLVPSYETDEELIQLLGELVKKQEPNTKVREYYIQSLNDYPWNTRNQ